MEAVDSEQINSTSAQRNNVALYAGIGVVLLLGAAALWYYMLPHNDPVDVKGYYTGPIMNHAGHIGDENGNFYREVNGRLERISREEALKTKVRPSVTPTPAGD